MIFIFQHNLKYAVTNVIMAFLQHEIVPSELVDRIAGLKRGGAFKNMRTLLRHKLVHHESKQCECVVHSFLSWQAS